MLYLVKITYGVAIEQLHVHLEAHRAWLAGIARAGALLVAGPLEDGRGGVVVAHCDTRAELDDLLAQDAYHIHQVADYEVTSFHAALHVQAFPAAWADQHAKVV